MGKSRVKGIVVEIGGDTIGLNKALEGTNKKINATQSNLKDVERLLKFDPKNTVLLEQKQKLLADAISETEGKLDVLNETNQQMADSVKNYDAWKAAYDPIQAEIDTTNQKLKDLKKQQAEMADCGEVDTDAYKQLTEEIQNTSKELRELKDRAKAVSDEFGNPISPEQYDSLQREIEDTKQKLRRMADEAQDAEKKLNGIDEKPLDDVADSADKAAAALDKATDKASTFGDVLKAETLVEGAKSIASGLKDVAEDSKEYRKIMGSLEVSSEAAGFTAEQTQEAFDRLYGVLGDSQGTATTVANLQAVANSHEELLRLIDFTTGAWAKYGDSIPIESLAESINETAKTGQVTGVLADILNWGAKENETYGVTVRDTTALQEKYNAVAENGLDVFDEMTFNWQHGIEATDDFGQSLEELLKGHLLTTDATEKEINATEEYLAELQKRIDADESWNQAVNGATTSEDYFNLALQETGSELERTNLIMQMLSGQGLSDMAEKWRENNSTLVESNEVNADLQEQLALLGEKIEPITTKITGMLVKVLDWFNGLDSGTQDFILGTVALIAALGPVGIAISGVSDLIKIFSGSDLPGLMTVFDKITGKALPNLQSGFLTVFGFIAAHPWIAVLLAAGAAIYVWGDEIQALLQKVDDFLQGVFAKDWTETFGPVLGGALNDFFATCKELWDSLKSILDGIIDFIRGVFTGDWERAWNGVVKIFDGIFSGLGTLLKAPINAVIGLINNAIDGINWLIDGVNKIPGVNLSTIGQIPMLADGGEVLRGSAVVGEGGPELLTVLGDRTVVQPLSQTTLHTNHLGGVNVHVYGAPGQNVRELAEIVMEEIQDICDSEEAAL